MIICAFHQSIDITTTSHALYNFSVFRKGVDAHVEDHVRSSPRMLPRDATADTLSQPAIETESPRKKQSKPDEPKVIVHQGMTFRCFVPHAFFHSHNFKTYLVANI